MTFLRVPTALSSPSSYLQLVERVMARWQPGDPEDRSLSLALDESRASGDGSYAASLGTALLLTLIARVHGQQKRQGECSTHLKEAEKLIESLPECPASLKLAWLLERARLSITEKTPSQARTAYAEAWSIAISGGDEDAAVEIAEMMCEIEPPKTRINWIEKGIELAVASKSDLPRRRLSALYLAQAWVQMDLRQYPEALRSFDLAKGSAGRFENTKEVVLAEWSKGKALRLMQRTNDALDLQMKLLLDVGAHGYPHADVYEEIAECLQALKRPEEAEAHYALAYHELSTLESLSERKSQTLKRLKTLGKVKTS